MKAIRARAARRFSVAARGYSARTGVSAAQITRMRNEKTPKRLKSRETTKSSASFSAQIRPGTQQKRSRGLRFVSLGFRFVSPRRRPFSRRRRSCPENRRCARNASRRQICTTSARHARPCAGHPRRADDANLQSFLRRSHVDGRDNPRINSGDGHDARRLQRLPPCNRFGFPGQPCAGGQGATSSLRLAGCC